MTEVIECIDFYWGDGSGPAPDVLFWLMYRTGVPLFRHPGSLAILLLPLAFGWLQVYGADSPLPLPLLRGLAYAGGYWLAFFIIPCMS